MEKQQIFKGLETTVEQARELARYWDKAGDGLGIITYDGSLITARTKWKRPMADSSFRKMKDAVEDNPVDWIVLMDSLMAVNFGKLQYNVEWVKNFIYVNQFGVADSEKGLMLFEEKKATNATWYQEMNWMFKGLTVENLGLVDKKLVCTSHNQTNPDYADWKTLYFIY